MKSCFYFEYRKYQQIQPKDMVLSLESLIIFHSVKQF